MQLLHECAFAISSPAVPLTAAVQQRSAGGWRFACRLPYYWLLEAGFQAVQLYLLCHLIGASLCGASLKTLFQCTCYHGMSDSAVQAELFSAKRKFHGNSSF